MQTKCERAATEFPLFDEEKDEERKRFLSEWSETCYRDAAVLI
jgi:hypothetical protein